MVNRGPSGCVGIEKKKIKHQYGVSRCYYGVCQFIYGPTTTYDGSATIGHGGATNAHDASTIRYGASTIQAGSVTTSHECAPFSGCHGTVLLGGGWGVGGGVLSFFLHM